MPQLGNGSKLRSVERRKTMKVETVYGHAREQPAQVRDREDSQPTEDMSEPIVETFKIIQCNAAEDQMTDDDVWAVQVPLAMSEDAVVDDHSGGDSQDWEMLDLTRGHFVLLGS
ncbi:hypothetical protein FHL15_004566 [Xylaria flabelliformis]|uniref:Uncharacterized protein n=1 Tax=Xylaria flabelliformis TaxID=2512241 RepID=A0A553I2J3_9PEZI|nr:hypothetical protein FHL15_004566 [Xylaria flabelliformis]